MLIHNIGCHEERTGDDLKPESPFWKKSSNYETGLTPESTHNVMLTESVMNKGNFEASPVSVQAQSPVSVQAQTRNKHSKYNLKSKDVQTKLQNKDENKDCQTKLQNKDENKDCPTNLQNKDCEKNMTEKYCQMSSQSTDHNSFLHSSGTSTFSDILTKTKGPCLTGLENGSQPCQQIHFQHCLRLILLTAHVFPNQ